MTYTILERGFVMDENRPTPSCHASTIVPVEGGYLCAWFGGSREGDSDVKIWLSRYTGGSWQDAVCVSQEEDVAHWNPVLFRNGDTVYLFYKVSEAISTWKTMVRTSLDEGGTFSPARELVPGDVSGGRGPVKNKPLKLSDGSILCPASREYADLTWRVFADRTADGFATLTRTEFVMPADPAVKLIQPSFFEDVNGIHMLMRSDRGLIYRADSADLGKTWGPAYPTAMPNNNSGLDLVGLPDGRIFLVCNPVGENWGKRSPLTLFVSTDGAASFQKVLDLETEEGEFSYPAILYDGALRITYTHKRERVAYAFLRV
ncbi:MAG: exo-alpha-sialidase [Clostridia bacterium]|nr:exo-alpha-sialidase [Clostridia bacterium]